jgi:hypothetical protein
LVGSFGISKTRELNLEGKPMTRTLVYAALVGMAGLAIASGGEQARTIPLESVYSTSEQPGLKRVTHAMIKDGDRMVYLEPYGYFLEKKSGATLAVG